MCMYIYIYISCIAHCLSLPPIGSCCNVFNMYLICMYVFLQKCILLFGEHISLIIVSSEVPHYLIPFYYFFILGTMFLTTLFVVSEYIIFNL